MSEQLLIRRDPGLVASGWTAIPNTILRDKTLSIEARWLWSYIHSHNGTFALKVAQMQEAAGVGRDKMRSMIKELETAGYLTRDQKSTDGHFGLVAYHLHNPRSGPATDLPAPVNPATATPAPENQGTVTSSQVATGDVFTGDGSTGAGESGPIKKTKKTSCSASAPPTARGTRLSEEWEVSPEMVRWCLNEHPNVNGKTETEKFRNYWHAKAGAGARKVDWARTWKNWIINADEHPFQRRRPGPSVHANVNGMEIER